MAARTGYWSLFATIFVTLGVFQRAAADQVVISEIMYHPPSGFPEYLEMVNITENPIDLSSWQVRGIDYTFPAYTDAAPTNAFLLPGERILLSPVDEATLRTAYPTIPAGVRVFTGWGGELSNNGELITVESAIGSIVCEVEYDDDAPWPEAADRERGHSLVVINPNYRLDDYRNWRASYSRLGTPGAPAESPGSLTGKITFSEAGYSPSNTVQWVEVFNTSDAAFSLGGLFLAYNDGSTNRFALSGTLLAGGTLSFDYPETLANSDLVILDSADRVLDVYITGDILPGDTTDEAFPMGSSEWFSGTTDTRDALNNPVRQTSVVINEIMADPLSDEDYMQYVELYNRGASMVDLSGWRIASGIEYQFPFGLTLDPGEYLVVAKDPNWVTATYGAGFTVVGPFDQNLSNDGELLRLEDAEGELADEVHFAFEGDWPEKARGLGSSLELAHPDMDNSRSSAWLDSDESAKSGFATYMVEGTYQEIDSRGSESDYNELHMHLVGDAHIELQNVSIQLNGAGANLISNGDTMSTNGAGDTGWLAQGTHHATFANAGTVHLISNGHGDNRANRAEIDATAMSGGNDYTISFDARWVYGKSRLIAQTWDHTVGRAFEVAVPNNLGTPGAANSVLAANPPPQVDNLLHQPAVPDVNEPVVVTADVFSTDNLQSVRTWFRLDNINGDGVWQFRDMLDDGNGDDERAGDGTYTATITSYMANNNIVQFYVEAITDNSEENFVPRPGEDLPGLWMVDSRAINSDLRSMRFVMSLSDRDKLLTAGGNSNPDPKYDYKFPRLSNNPFNCTVIANETDIRYNGGIRKSGSPFTRAQGNALDRGKWQLPRDRMWRNIRKYSFDNDPAGGNREKNRLIRYWLYVMGHPSNESEIVWHYINADNPRLTEEIEPNGNALLQRNFERGVRGELYRIDDQWWFEDNWSRGSRDADWNYKGTDEPIRYHSEWMKRSREQEYDYSAFIDFVQTLTADQFTESQINSLVDPEFTAMMAAIRGYLSDWDSLTLDRGKNGYWYRKPTDGRFMFLHWDSDLGFQANRINQAFIGNLAQVRTYLFKPYIKRRFNHYLAKLHTDYTIDSTRIATFLQLEDQINSYDANVPLFEDWFRNRESNVLTELGTTLTQPFSIATGDGSSLATTNVVDTLSGQAPSTVHAVEIPGHPEAVVSWNGLDEWTLSNILLTEGANPLVVNAVDFQGNIITNLSFTFNKTGNSPPVIDLDVEPGSWNVNVAESLSVDARGSYDPEGQLIDFEFEITGPAPVTTVLSGNGGRATFTFSEPGLYDVTVTVTDLGGEVATFSRQASVYGVTGFSNFNDLMLDAWWIPDNLERRDNFSPGSSYSFDESDGFLAVQLIDDEALPLTFNGYTYPWLRRTLPSTADWSLQTKLELDTRKFGSYQAGLLVDLDEAGSVRRYAFGVQDGNTLEVIEIDGADQQTALASIPIVDTSFIVRVRREGTTLNFEYLVEDSWTSAHSEGLPLSTTATSGGFFANTEIPQSARFLVDYVMLVEMVPTVNPYENLRITEIMYEPVGGSDHEYIELMNVGTSNLNLNGLSFVDGQAFAPFAFPNIDLGAGERILVVRNYYAFIAANPTVPLDRIAGEWVTGRLSNGGELITIVDANTNVVLSVEYDNGGDWPDRPEGGGSSLEIIDPLGDPNDSSNWRASSEYGGTPGGAGSGPRTDIRINEILAHTDPPAVDTIELYNTTASPIDIGGWYLSDSSDYKKYRIPDGTLISGFGYLTFDETDFNPNGEWNPSPGVPGPNEFGLSSAGDDVWLTEADASSNIVSFVDHEEFDGSATGVSFGHYTNSIGEEFMTAQLSQTLLAANSEPRVGPVVITELMYHPDTFMAEYIELQNITNVTVDLFSQGVPANTWRLAGVGYSFPTNISLAPSEVIIVSAIEPDALRTMYSVPADVRIFGPWGGILRDDGEQVTLYRPDLPNVGETEPPEIPVDRVRYESTLPWPTLPNGLGFSLERIDPTSFGTDPANWEPLTFGGSPGETTLPPSTPLIRFDAFEYNVEVNEFSNPTNRTLMVWNAGIGVLNYTISSDQSWLQVVSGSGSSNDENDPVSHSLVFDTDELAAGSYVAMITATDPSAVNSPLSIPVYLTVNEPVIAASPISLELFAHPGSNHDPVPIEIFNEGPAGTVLNYGLTSDAGWMDVDPTSGMSTGPSDRQSHTLSFSNSGLPLGSYEGSIIVTDPSAPNAPFNLMVGLSIVEVAATMQGVTGVGVGTATFEALITNTVGTADVFFYFGREDGGTDPAAWDHVVAAGSSSDGLVSFTVSNLLYGIDYDVRVFVDAQTDTAWSTNAVQFSTDAPPGSDVTRGLYVRTFSPINGFSAAQKEALLDDASRLLNDPATGSHVFDDAIFDYNNAAAIRAAYPSISADDHMAIAWYGVMIIEESDVGLWSFGTASDDGSVWHIDLNRDGDFTDPGELVVDNNFLQGRTERMGQAAFPAPGCYPIVIGFYEHGGGENMEAKYAKGDVTVYNNLTFLDGSLTSTQVIARDCPPPDISVNNGVASNTFYTTSDLSVDVDAEGTFVDVYVHYGTTDGGTNAQNWTYSQYAGSVAGSGSTNLSAFVERLVPGLNWWTYELRNDVESIWDPASHLVLATAPPQRPVIESIEENGTQLVLQSSGADGGASGWVVDVQYTTDDIRLNENVTWLPCTIVGNNFSNGTNMTTVQRPPVAPNQRFYLRILNINTNP